jgi:hypothetical protein
VQAHIDVHNVNRILGVPCVLGTQRYYMSALRTLGFAVLAVMTISAVGISSVSTTESAGIAAQDAQATYVRVCIDRRGVADRRACHHTSRQDPQRTTLALR